MFVIYIVPNLTYLKMKVDVTFGRKKTNEYEYQQMRDQQDKESPTGKDGRQSVGNFGSNDKGEDEEIEFENRIKPSSKGMFAVILIFSLFVTSYGILAFVFQLTG